MSARIRASTRANPETDPASPSPVHTVGLWPQKAGQKRLRSDVRKMCSATGCRRATRWYCLTCDADGPVPICAPWSGRPCFADHAANGDGAEHVLTATGLAACMVCGRSNASRCSCGAAICTVVKGGTGSHGRCYRSHLRENGTLAAPGLKDNPVEDGSSGRATRPDEGLTRRPPP